VPTEREFAHRSGQATKVLARANDALLHTKDAALALERTLSLLRDAETGQRGSPEFDELTIR
jgi:alpha-D-ribose 1-methylphosphonate 5-triphosphate synthase subunit PhnG